MRKAPKFNHQGVLLIESIVEDRHVHFFEGDVKYGVTGKTPNQEWTKTHVMRCACGATK